MKSDLKFWRDKSAYDLVDAALLIVEMNPEDYPDIDKLISKPPANFLPIYKEMLRDAVSVLDDKAKSEEYDDVYYTRYKLHTNESETITKATTIKPIEGRNYTVDKDELKDWLKKRSLSSRFFEDETLKAFDKTKLSSFDERECESMLRIIGALATNAYKYPDHGAMKKMITGFETNLNGVDEKTLKKYLDEFQKL